MPAKPTSKAAKKIGRPVTPDDQKKGRQNFSLNKNVMRRLREAADKTELTMTNLIELCVLKELGSVVDLYSGKTTASAPPALTSVKSVKQLKSINKELRSN